eukprot:scaffold17676_cov108-Isochrysis_galbana.AAC.4
MPPLPPPPCPLLIGSQQSGAGQGQSQAHTLPYLIPAVAANSPYPLLLHTRGVSTWDASIVGSARQLYTRVGRCTTV